MKAGNQFIFKNSINNVKGIIFENIEDDLIYDGVVFGISKRVLIGGGATINITFDPTGCIPDYEKLIFLPVSFKFFGAGPIFIDFYVNPTYSEDGTIIQSTNRDFESSNISSSIWRLNPTVSDSGIQTSAEFSVLSDGTAAVSKAGGETRENQITKIDMTKKYLFKLINQNGSTSAHGVIASTWAELPIGFYND